MSGIQQILLAGGPAVFNVDYFLIAGGSGGRSGYYATSTNFKAVGGTTYTVTVGAGSNTTGGSSVFGNITATSPTNFGNGAGAPGNYAAGGGGGAGAAGSNYYIPDGQEGRGSWGGPGGNGVQNGYNGAGTFYYGGGAGGWSYYAQGGNGGYGGGGGGGGQNQYDPGDGPGAGGPGPPGGSGGGGSFGSGPSIGATGAGGTNSGSGGSPAGSGVVIIRYPSTSPAATATTGSPVVNTTGGYRIYRWTGSGSITF